MLFAVRQQVRVVDCARATRSDGSGSDARSDRERPMQNGVLERAGAVGNDLRSGQPTATITRSALCAVVTSLDRNERPVRSIANQLLAHAR